MENRHFWTAVKNVFSTSMLKENDIVPFSKKRDTAKCVPFSSKSTKYVNL